MLQNVLFVSGIAGDTRRYRCLHHQEQLALQGIASTLREADDRQLYVDATTHDLFILHRVDYSDLIGDLLTLAHLRGVPVIFETDDLIFEPDLYRSIAYLDTLSPDAAQRFRSSLDAQAKSFALSDAILTTTQYLADAAAKHGKPVFIQRNACSAEMLRTAEAAYERRLNRIATGEVVIGYFSGTGSHNRDFALVTPALLEVLQRYPQVWLHVSGQLDLDTRFQAFQARIRRAPFIAWQELPNLVAQIDINLAPLVLDNPFCQAKSEIKYTEAALVGVPTIASPTDAFAYAIRQGENGLLAATNEDWLTALCYLIENPDTRQQIGERARAHTYAEYAPQPRSQALVATLEEIAATYQPSQRDLTQVPTAVAQMMKRHLDGLLGQQQQLTRQLEQLRQTLATWEAKAQPAALNQHWRQQVEQLQQQQVEVLQDILTRLQKRGR
jgi:glycosyltransferase involved in cell wall biosynthesis